MAEEPKTQMVDVEILRDFWDVDCVRRPAGTVISVPVEAAMDGIERGALRRAKKDGK
jgi:hypothetical protein